VLTLLVGASGVLAGCASTDTRRAALTPATTALKDGCGHPFAEQLDPASSQHLLPGAPEPPYVSNPPTSGAHQPGNHPTGVLTAEMTKPVQAALLEGGGVIIQYRGVDGTTQANLEQLTVGQTNVTVAPNATLPAPIVATAWMYKLTCQRFEATALQTFITTYLGETQAQP